jgi:hypothetical protein
MTLGRLGIVCAFFGAALSACSQFAPRGAAAVPAGAAPAVEQREHVSERFLALIGPKMQHDPPFLGIPGTNFYCLRSILDLKSGETAHQLYVSDSYDGAERNWDGAHYGAGQAMAFVPISRHQISCDGGCSYVEEFAANIPENKLRSSPNGLAVTFTDRAGDRKTINISANQIATQIAALDAQRRAGPTAAAAAPAQAASHQPE